ncbi:helix-turn-helix domain-containing protein [Rhodoferax sp.]|uniref:Crp/Fnr family transcriptional regulator n=1 Tax=Rhodoferax sp. TaxID=50421 RepID=UPI0025DC2ECF|nr:helix-turn-helix domain-containing protein [Rhodoferax sp.]
MKLHPVQAVDDRVALDMPAAGVMLLVHMETIWRLESGALRIGHLQADGRIELVGVVLPGDLVGVEYWAGERVALQVSALVPSRLVPVDMRRISMEAVLREALLTARQRAKDMVSVRTGPVAERVRSLLLLLAEGSGGAAGRALPSIKECAELVGSAPETVCRVLGHLKDLHLLAERRRGEGALDIGHLREVRFSQGMTSSVARTRAAPLTRT